MDLRRRIYGEKVQVTQPALDFTLVPETPTPSQPSSPAAQEAKRLNDAQLAVLQFLKARGAAGVLNWEISVPPYGISGTRRLRELRAMGYAIDMETVNGQPGTRRYVLKGIRPL